MKLKQRAMMVVGVMTLFSMMLFTFSVFYYSKANLPNDFHLRTKEFFMKRTIAENFKKGRSLKKKPASVNDKTGNESYYDSNHAAEVELSEREYDELLQNNKILPR
ncbi:hypothetical protein CEXT_814421 [Caerostris extrusa]|uniref:Uncharacterized protein n=1 Tax=Caerostris extrusa TaxID=172846 RepID=A0AAV4P2I3_CAEEX|nr:hypothetical protein CEXT_814421 [Caerostris extrusa]